jgi:NDP-mannose synthase
MSRRKPERAVLLAGGKGTRLRPFTATLPKVLVPVGERAVLEILLRRLHRAGVRKITLAVNHFADIIMACFGRGEKLGLEIDYSLEDKPLGTVGPLKLIRNLPENFLVMNGDLLTDLSFGKLYQAHLKEGADLTVATCRRTSKIDFGVLAVDPLTRRVVGFREKPVYSVDVSMGVYVFNRRVLECVPENRPFGFDELVLTMLKQKRAIHTYPFQGYWLDIGRPDDYEQANRDINKLAFED